VWALAAGGTHLGRWRPPRPGLLLLGSEGHGLSPPARAAADGTVSIAMARGLESLNVAVAAGIVLARALSCEGDS
jgi:TrmH family RNA methyltransferase